MVVYRSYSQTNICSTCKRFSSHAHIKNYITRNQLTEREREREKERERDRERDRERVRERESSVNNNQLIIIGIIKQKHQFN